MGWKPYCADANDHCRLHKKMEGSRHGTVEEIHEIQDEARRNGVRDVPRWPMIVLRSPKGWTGPKTVDGKQVEGTWRAHQVPVADLQLKPEHVKILEDWMKGYRPDELFDKQGR